MCITGRVADFLRPASRGEGRFLPSCVRGAHFSSSLEQQHPPDLTEQTGVQPVQVDPAGHGRSRLVGAVPGHAVITGRLPHIDQQARAYRRGVMGLIVAPSA